MDLFLAAERCPVSRVENWWWEQEGLYLEGVRTEAWEAEQEEGEEEIDRMATDTGD